MNKRILIIEDEESIADLEKDYLELSNFEVEVANDGEQGLAQAMEQDFDPVSYTHLDVYKRQAGYGVYEEFVSGCGKTNFTIY